MVSPFSPDANPLDYAFWPHIEARACNVRHSYITALKTSVDREWMALSRDYVFKSCIFRRCLEGIIASDGGYIDEHEATNTVFNVQSIILYAQEDYEVLGL